MADTERETHSGELPVLQPISSDTLCKWKNVL